MKWSGYWYGIMLTALLEYLDLLTQVTKSGPANARPAEPWALALTGNSEHDNFYTLTLCFSRTALTIFLFGVRGFATSFFQVIYLYTPEVN